MFEIEKNIPLPKNKQNYKYPLRELEVGESFTIPLIQKAIVAAHMSHIKHQSGKVFTLRTIDKETVRVWRTK